MTESSNEAGRQPHPGQEALHPEAIQPEALQQRLILEAAKDYAIFTTDLARRITTWNAGAQALFGYAIPDILGQLADTLFTPQDRQQGIPQQEATKAQTQGRAENERWHLHQNGSWLYGSGVTSPLFDPTGALNGLVTVMQDRTAQKRAEDALRESEQRWRLAIDAARMATWEWNLETNQVFWNEQHFRLFGMEPQPNPISPDAFFAHVRVDERERVAELLQAALVQGGVFDTEFWALRADGQERYMSGYGRVNEERGGRAVHMNGVMFDITNRKVAEDSLRESNRRKDEFLAMLAHELRNPLAPIRNGLQILTLTAEPGSQSGPLVSLMSGQVDHLVRLVDDLLDVSRISQGKIDLKRERVEVGAIVSGSVEAARPLYQARRQTLQLEPPTAPLYVDGDATRLAQLVTNLLTNSTRYTAEGGRIQVGLASVGDQALLRVTDNGIGLEAGQLEAIFELFVQVDNSVARTQGGLGLGLTLVQRIAELHGGRVEAHSQGLGLGSEFRVYLPLLVASQPSLAGQPTASPNPLEDKPLLLLIDDNAEAVLTLAMLLRLKGYAVQTRTSGRAGLEAAQQLRPVAILLDIGMPDMDGYETCRRLRQQAWGQQVPVIALTGYGQAEDKQRTQTVGFTAHLVKPVDLDGLLQLLAQLMH